jgi:hypothetical protein
MPISSYPRITLNNTQKDNNPQSGIGMVIYDYGIDAYRVLDSNSVPVNEGGFASNNNLISSLGPKLPDLLVDQDDITIANRTKEIQGNLIASNYSNQGAGDLLYEILVELQLLNSSLSNGTNAIQIKGSNGNLAHVSSANKLDVRL